MKWQREMAKRAVRQEANRIRNGLRENEPRRRAITENIDVLETHLTTVGLERLANLLSQLTGRKEETV